MKESDTESAIQVDERIVERLRQERETFDQYKAHQNRWFFLRLVMGYSSLFLLLLIMGVSSYVLLNNSSFPIEVITTAGAALFVDVLGLVVTVVKVVFNPDFMTKLAPVTQMQSSDVPSDNTETSPASAVAQKELIILSAKYGVEGKMEDVTPKVRSMISGGKLAFRVCNPVLVGVDNDPAPGIAKHLVVFYSYDNKTQSIKVAEGEDLLLP